MKKVVKILYPIIILHEKYCHPECPKRDMANCNLFERHLKYDAKEEWYFRCNNCLKSEVKETPHED